MARSDPGREAWADHATRGRGHSGRRPWPGPDPGGSARLSRRGSRSRRLPARRRRHDRPSVPATRDLAPSRAPGGGTTRKAVLTEYGAAVVLLGFTLWGAQEGRRPGGTPAGTTLRLGASRCTAREANVPLPICLPGEPSTGRSQTVLFVEDGSSGYAAISCWPSGVKVMDTNASSEPFGGSVISGPSVRACAVSSIGATA